MTEVLTVDLGVALLAQTVNILEKETPRYLFATEHRQSVIIRTESGKDLECKRRFTGNSRSGELETLIYLGVKIEYPSHDVFSQHSKYVYSVQDFVQSFDPQYGQNRDLVHSIISVFRKYRSFDIGASPIPKTLKWCHDFKRYIEGKKHE